jgi:hypothetical protein
MDEPEQKSTKAKADSNGPALRLVGGSGQQRTSSRQASAKRRAVLELVNEAIETEQELYAVWLEHNRPTAAYIQAIDLHGDAIHAYDTQKEGAELYLPLDAILEISAGDDAYLDGDDEYFDDGEPD